MSRIKPTKRGTVYSSFSIPLPAHMGQAQRFEDEREKSKKTIKDFIFWPTLEQIDEGEDQNPNQVHKMPKKTRNFQAVVVPIVVKPTSGPNVFPNEIADSGENMESVKGRDIVKGRAEKGRGRPVFERGELDAKIVDQVNVLIDLHE